MAENWTIAINGGEPIRLRGVEIEQRSNDTQQWSRGRWKADPKWEFTDAFGHVHRWVEADDEMTLPTLVKTWVPCNGACGDPEHVVPEYHCAYCDIEVEPGLKFTGPYTFTVPGMREATLRFEPERWSDFADLVDVELRREGGTYLRGRGWVTDWNSDRRGLSVRMELCDLGNLVV